MKKIKSVVVLLLVFSMVIGLFSACSNNNTAKKETKAEVVTQANSKQEEDKQKEVKQENDKQEEVTLPDFIKEETDTAVTYIDPFGEETTVKKEPQKVIVLNNSMLDIWYLAGGEAIGRVKGEINIPEGAKDIEIVGSTSQPNIERLLALQPDLVIMSNKISKQIEMKDLLKNNNIAYMYMDISMNPLEKFNDALKLFSMINNKKDVYDKVNNEINGKIEEICEKVKSQEGPKFAILSSSKTEIKAELPCGLVGNIAAKLGGDNFINELSKTGSSKVSLSLEKLIEEDPDILFIINMGDLEKCQKRMKEEMQANEAWNSLTAVKEGKIYYLPQELFVYKPNARYPEAFQYLAEIMYPQVFEQNK